MLSAALIHLLARLLTQTQARGKSNDEMAIFAVFYSVLDHSASLYTRQVSKYDAVALSPFSDPFASWAQWREQNAFPFCLYFEVNVL